MGTGGEFSIKVEMPAVEDIYACVFASPFVDGLMDLYGVHNGRQQNPTALQVITTKPPISFFGGVLRHMPGIFSVSYLAGEQKNSLNRNLIASTNKFTLFHCQFWCCRHSVSDF